VDGSPVPYRVAEDFTLSYNPQDQVGGKALSDGLHTVLVRAANRPEEPVYLAWSFTVRTSEEPHPTLSDFSPAPDLTLEDLWPFLSAQVQGEGTEISTVRMLLDGKVVNATYTPATGTVYYQWGTGGGEEPLSQGGHTVLVEATDARGVTEVASWVFWVEAPESE